MRITFSLIADPPLLMAALEGLTAVNAVLLARAARPVPRLYDSGVRYKREAPGREDWLHVGQVLKRKSGDCEDLSAWRAAELRVYDAEPARVVVIRTGPRTLHAVVQRADGRVEDPSRLLGMR